ncbi:acyl-CoA dehydrogenase family protein [Mycobacterium vicinigordonae]|uniref:Acyl-CoA dehydrogenase family protein n=1 Tax=Mycobacterium vicinigordonae TaxID=1719132 RepID=A0A7D6I9G1_9MYCO|nr:acyl-CoA dehydrogenase family protein [Mycobacterium vicinigordonae]QLL09096.1 acyl-CoA dehydrogenase family protein [Mycobacterium vicinigordonae]
MPSEYGRYASDIAGFRQDFRRFLQELQWAAEWRAAAFDNAEEGLAFDANVLGRLFEAGWCRYGWPPSAGGLGGNEIHRAVYYEELANATLPVPAQHWTLETLGPALLKFAPRLAAEHLPKYLSGAEWWGQGFSEPEAGSDLANLRTRAADDGHGGFVVNGQKIWTSQGSTAARLLVLARTGTAESRHRGLTMFMIDANSPGVTIRPIAIASGRQELAEVFFDDVRVDTSRLVGDMGQGWAVAMYLMQFERGMYGYAALTKTLSRLTLLRNEMAKRKTSAAHRQRFAQTYVAVVAAQARCAATVRKLASGTPIGPATSVDKLLFSTAEKDAGDLILDIRRDWMIGGYEETDRNELDTARAEWWYSRAATIMGGTAEIQRGIIADHLLRLPKEVGK